MEDQNGGGSNVKTGLLFRVGEVFTSKGVVNFVGKDAKTNKMKY